MELQMFYDFDGDEQKVCFVNFDGACWFMSMGEARLDGVVFAAETAARIIPWLQYVISRDSTFPGPHQINGEWIAGGYYDGIHGQHDIGIELCNDGKSIRIWEEQDNKGGEEVRFDISDAWTFLALLEMDHRLDALGNLARKTWR